jgi:hypothetical protein
VHHVEQVQVRRVLPGPLADLGRVEDVEPLLEGAEAREPAVVEADDLPVEGGRRGQTLFQRGRDVGELEVLLFAVAADEADAPAVKPAPDAQPVELGLK